MQKEDKTEGDGSSFLLRVSRRGDKQWEAV